MGLSRRVRAVAEELTGSGCATGGQVDVYAHPVDAYAMRYFREEVCNAVAERYGAAGRTLVYMDDPNWRDWPENRALVKSYRTPEGMGSVYGWERHDDSIVREVTGWPVVERLELGAADRWRLAWARFHTTRAALHEGLRVTRDDKIEGWDALYGDASHPWVDPQLVHPLIEWSITVFHRTRGMLPPYDAPEHADVAELNTPDDLPEPPPPILTGGSDQAGRRGAHSWREEIERLDAYSSRYVRGKEPCPPALKGSAENGEDTSRYAEDTFRYAGLKVAKYLARDGRAVAAWHDGSWREIVAGI